MLHLLAGTGITPLPVALFQQDGDLFMAEEFADGTRLDRWARQHQPGPTADGSDAALLAALEQVCDAVGAFHSRGLIRRDLSPTNILINAGTPAGEGADWVTVGICDVEHVAFSGTAPSPVGTPGFNPPEQWAGKAVRPPSDLCALGALLYYICTGQAPLLGRDDPPGSPTAQRMLQLLANCAPSRHLKAMTSLIVALLADHPAGRPSLTDVNDHLRQALHSPATGESAGTGAAGGTRNDATAQAGTDTRLVTAIREFRRQPGTWVGGGGAGRALTHVTLPAVVSSEC